MNNTETLHWTESAVGTRVPCSSHATRREKVPAVSGREASRSTVYGENTRRMVASKRCLVVALRVSDFQRETISSVGTKASTDTTPVIETHGKVCFLRQ